MTPEKQASLLAEWLEKPPGTAPPEGVDSDALEAIYALRPELAPAPRVSIDDILAGVSEGPFSRTAEVPIARTAEVPISEAPTEIEDEVIVEADPETGRGEVVDFAAARRRRTRVWGAIGTMAAAALILFTVLPADDGFENLAKEAPTADPVAQVASPEAVQTAEDYDRPNEDLAELDALEEGEATPARPAKQERTGRYDALKNLSSADMDAGDLSDGLAPSGGGASYGPAPEELHLEDAEQKAAEPDPEPALAGLGYVEAEEAQDEAAYDTLDVAQPAASESRKTRSSWGNREKDESPKSSSRASSSTTAGSSAYDAPAAEPEPIPSDLDALRAAAFPSDYSASWYLRALDDAGLDRVDAAISSGDYASLISDPDPRVGQDFAGRAAQEAASSSSSNALGYVNEGLRRSSANTPFLSRLYALQGQILEAQGDVEGAKAAYTNAANLNRAR
ncbi:MAG: hypothetical protein GY913_26795 [Proteobacteria bacterium]|nr:hypothetical protein [Pseudomonadota bacterium]MCP4920523.1 hypothetical protein [Pseudomonadota bacterium]